MMTLLTGGQSLDACQLFNLACGANHHTDGAREVCFSIESCDESHEACHCFTSPCNSNSTVFRTSLANRVNPLTPPLWISGIEDITIQTEPEDESRKAIAILLSTDPPRRERTIAFCQFLI